jgi:putative hydrolase of the HAD superfamily
MIAAEFSNIRTWVFDLDNTLYPPHMRLFDQIERKMVAWIIDFLGVSVDEANRLRKTYWEKHGTTLAGLMAEHGMPPEQFLIDVHDIDFSVLSPDPTLRAQIESLPGRKIIYTNGTAPYADAVSTARGLSGLFSDIYGVEHADYHPKPADAAFKKVFGTAGIDGTNAAMFEDEARNLAYPFTLGMKTVHIAPTPDTSDYITHHGPDLSGFLKQVLA